MTFGADLTAAVLDLRALAESRMLDTCSIRRVTGEAVNATTGVVTPTYSAPLYEGACRVQSHALQERNPEVAGHTATTQRYQVHVPVGSYAPAVGDVVTITAATLDEHLTGRAFRVVALLHKSQATAYRLGVEEVVA